MELTRKWDTSGGEQGGPRGTGHRKCACRVGDCMDPAAHGGTAHRAYTQQRAATESLAHVCLLDRPAQQQFLRGDQNKSWFCCNPSRGGCLKPTAHAGTARRAHAQRRAAAVKDSGDAYLTALHSSGISGVT